MAAFRRSGWLGPRAGLMGGWRFLAVASLRGLRGMLRGGGVGMGGKFPHAEETSGEGWEGWRGAERGVVGSKGWREGKGREEVGWKLCSWTMLFLGTVRPRVWSG